MGGETQEFGHFILRKRIATGGMGELFLAHTASSGRPVVVKRIGEKYLDSSSVNAQFLEEASLGNSLQHKNIVRVLGTGASFGTRYIEMEYIEGVDCRALRKLTRKKLLSTKHVLFIVSEVCSALEYVHNARDSFGVPLRLVHCDLSPGNVMVSTQGEVKLLDFGIAVKAEETQHKKPLFGKPGYSAPELLLARKIDGRADVFSVGVVLFELLTGHRLFPKIRPAGFAEHVDRISKGEFPLPSEINSDLEPLDFLVEKSVQAEPSKRLQSAEALGRAVLAALEQESPGYTPADLGQVIATVAPLFEGEPTWRYADSQPS